MADSQHLSRESQSGTTEWDSRQQSLLKATLSATPAQRLAWLEEALELAYRAGALKGHRQQANDHLDTSFSEKPDKH